MLRNLINNDLVYYGLIVIALIIAINIFAKFVENVFSLGRNFKIIIFYLKIGLIKLFKLLIKTIFFPITFYKWYKEYQYYNQLNINNSRYKEI